MGSSTAQASQWGTAVEAVKGKLQKATEKLNLSASEHALDKSRKGRLEATLKLRQGAAEHALDKT